MSCGWEGNRRSGVALAMNRRLQWFIYLRAHGLRKGDEHPAYTPHEAWHTLGPLTLPYLHAKAMRSIVFVRLFLLHLFEPINPLTFIFACVSVMTIACQD